MSRPTDIRHAALPEASAHVHSWLTSECLFAGAKDDAIISELAEARDGPMAGDVCDGARAGRSAIHHAELVCFHVLNVTFSQA